MVLCSAAKSCATQVRINNGTEVVGALTALLGSAGRGDLPRDLLVLNFGLHYNRSDIDGQLAEDVRQLRELLHSNKVSLQTSFEHDSLGGLLLHGFTSRHERGSSVFYAGLFMLPL